MRKIFSYLLIVMLLLAIGFIKCTDNKDAHTGEFNIDFPLINNTFELDRIWSYDNLVKDTTIIQGVRSLFEKDAIQSPEYYGNWWGYYYITQTKDVLLVLRVDEDKIYDEILILRSPANNELQYYHVAREYFDGYYFDLMNSVFYNDTLQKNIRIGYFDDSLQQNITILDTVQYLNINNYNRLKNTPFPKRYR